MNIVTASVYLTKNGIMDTILLNFLPGLQMFFPITTTI